MKIAIIVEGKTETAFRPHLRAFLEPRLQGKMPRLDIFKYDGRVPKAQKLRRVVANLLSQSKPPADAVIALTDVYTGTDDFKDAADAKRKMNEWVGPEKRFYPHVAQHDFEAWLLPYWSDIQKIAGQNKSAPPGAPESVNHSHPPSYYVGEIFRQGTCKRHYSKARDANRILRGQDLSKSAEQCSELKAFLNTILSLCGGQPL
jgi:hypothetical protein